MWSKDSVKWLYKLDENFTWASGVCVPGEMVFKDKKGAVRLIIEESGDITVTSGYAWNGCSPKFCTFDLLFGTPEGVVSKKTERPKTYYASLIHDALYQFYPDGLPFDRRQADGFFLRLLAESNFAPRNIYWFFVRVFGGLIWRATRAKRENHGTHQRVSELMPDRSEVVELSR